MPLSGNELRSWQPRKSSSGATDAVLAHRLVRPVGVTGVDDRQLLDLAGRRRVAERHLDDLDDAVVDLAALLLAERAAGRALAERVARVQHVHRLAARRGQQRVRVRSAVLVDGRDLPRFARIRDVEDRAGPPRRRRDTGSALAVGNVLADRRGAAVRPCQDAVDGQHERVGLAVAVAVEDRRVALRPVAARVGDELRLGLRDVEDAEAAVVADVGESPQNAMSELVTCVLAALNGFCAVWKLAKNQKFWPNGWLSGVPSSSGSCASAALLDMAIATAHTAVRTFHRLFICSPPEGPWLRRRTPRRPLRGAYPIGSDSSARATASRLAAAARPVLSDQSWRWSVSL